MTLDPSSVILFQEFEKKSEEGYVYAFGIKVPLSNELYDKAISKEYIVFVIHEPEQNQDFYFEGFEIGDSGKRPKFSISYNHPKKEMVLSIHTQEMSPGEKKAVMNFISSIEK
jgi:hypothetical protein